MKKRTDFFLQQNVGKWGRMTFPDGTPDGVVAHLKLEVVELAENHEPVEAADCFILLLQHAELCGYDLITEAINKLEINKGRTWGKPGRDGVIEHIREGGNAKQTRPA